MGVMARRQRYRLPQDAALDRLIVNSYAPRTDAQMYVDQADAGDPANYDLGGEDEAWVDESIQLPGASPETQSITGWISDQAGQSDLGYEPGRDDPEMAAARRSLPLPPQAGPYTTSVPVDNLSPTDLLMNRAFDRTIPRAQRHISPDSAPVFGDEMADVSARRAEFQQRNGMEPTEQRGLIDQWASRGEPDLGYDRVRNDLRDWSGDDGRPADMTFTEEEVYGDRPADMTFTEEELYSQPGEQLTDRTEQYYQNAADDAPNVVGYDTRAAVTSDPVQKYASPYQTIKRTAQDDALAQADDDATSTHLTGLIGNVIGDLINAKGSDRAYAQLDQRVREKRAEGMQRAAGLQDRYDAEQAMGFKAQQADAQRALAAQRLAQSGERLQIQNENADQREARLARSQDPTSDWSQARRGNANADWEARRQATEAQRAREYEARRADMLQRAAAAGGNTQAMRAAGMQVGGGSPGAATRIQSIGDASADAVMSRYTNAGLDVPPAVRAQVAQLQNPDLDDVSRGRLHNQISQAVDEDIKRKEAKAEEYGQARSRSNVDGITASLNSVERIIGEVRLPNGDVPGIGFWQNLAGSSDNRLLQMAGSVMAGEDGRRVRNALGMLKAEVQRMETGAAATDQEMAVFRQITGLSESSVTPQDLANAIGDLRRVVRERDQALIQTYGPDAAAMYARRQSGAREASGNVQTISGQPATQATITRRTYNPNTGMYTLYYSDGRQVQRPGPPPGGSR